jgi:hypothetical protein
VEGTLLPSWAANVVRMAERRSVENAESGVMTSVVESVGADAVGNERE